MTERLEYAMNVVRHLESVATTPELRAAFNAVQPKVSAFYSSLPLNEGLWKAVQRYASTAEARSLTGAMKRYLTKTIDSFKRHGADLPAEGKAGSRKSTLRSPKSPPSFRRTCWIRPMPMNC